MSSTLISHKKLTQILTDIFGNLDSTDSVVLLKVINKAKAKAKQKPNKKPNKNNVNMELSRNRFKSFS